MGLSSANFSGNICRDETGLTRQLCENVGRAADGPTTARAVRGVRGHGPPRGNCCRRIDYVGGHEGLGAASSRHEGGSPARRHERSDPSGWNHADYHRLLRLRDKTASHGSGIASIFSPRMMASPQHSLRDLRDIVRGLGFAEEQLFAEMVAFDARRLGNRFEVPFFVFQGDSDVFTPAAVAEAYVAEVQAPVKHFERLPQSGHLGAFVQPHVFLERLRHWVLPAVVSRAQRNLERAGSSGHSSENTGSVAWRAPCRGGSSMGSSPATTTMGQSFSARVSEIHRSAVLIFHMRGEARKLGRAARSSEDAAAGGGSAGHTAARDRRVGGAGAETPASIAHGADGGVGGAGERGASCAMSGVTRRVSRAGFGGHPAVATRESDEFRAEPGDVTRRLSVVDGGRAGGFGKAARDEGEVSRAGFVSFQRRGGVLSRAGMAMAAVGGAGCVSMKGNTSSACEAAPGELGEALSAVRLCAPHAQQEMQLSLSKLGQLTPVQAYRVGTGLELFDGLKRVRAARELSWPKLRVEVHKALDSAGAKVRLLRCNAGAGLSDLEEAWLVRSLYREDQLTQPQISVLLGRHKSWVCRRLTLAEELSDELTASVRLGLVSATAAVELGRLQRCNQDAAAQSGGAARADDAADGTSGRRAAGGVTAEVAEPARGGGTAGAAARPRGRAAAYARRTTGGGCLGDEGFGRAPARAPARAFAAEPGRGGLRHHQPGAGGATRDVARPGPDAGAPPGGPRSCPLTKASSTRWCCWTSRG